MEFKGTKGPWTTTFEDDEKYDQPIVTIHGGETQNFATVWSGRDIGDEIDECTLADALLISKAPEMLEAMIEFCKRVDKGEISSTYTYKKFKRIISEATEL